MADIGFLLVGHGTRNKRGQEQLREVFAQFARILAQNPCALGFLELAEPDIEAGIRLLATGGVKKLVTVPVLLFSAGHALEDIPQEVAKAAAKYEIEPIAQTRPFETAAPILKLSSRRFREAACCTMQCNPCFASIDPNLDCSMPCQDGCSGQTCPDVSLLMVGRGSNSDAAADKMREFTQQRIKQTPVSEVNTCFIHGQSPDVPTAMDQLEQSDCGVAVVQPHLLFEGLLIEQLREEVGRRQANSPNKRWVITNTLGVDHELAVALAELALDVAHV